MVKKRGKNSWLIQIYLGRDAQGKKQYYYETFHSPVKSLASQREMSLKLKLRNIGPKQAISTVGELMDKWLAAVSELNNLSERTIETYTWQVNRLQPVVGNINLFNLTAFQIQEALKGKFDDVAYRTRKNFYSTIRTALRQGFSWGLLATNVSAGIIVPAGESPEKPVLTFEQLLKLLEVAQNYKHYLVLRILVVTGARLSEILGLSWKNVDFEQGAISIIRAADSRNRVVREKTKTKSSKRKIILDVETIEYLKELKQQQSSQVVISLSREDDRLVFSENGKPIRHRAIQLTLKRALKKGELPDIGIHNIRHSVVSILADEGVSLGALLSLTGHSNLSSADPYYHRTKEGLNIIDTLKQKAYK